MNKEDMGAALTQYAIAVSPTPFNHTIEVTSKTRGGDIHLNGKHLVRIHPCLIEQEVPIPVLIHRIFEVIKDKREAPIRLRRRAIKDTKASVTPSIQYLMRAMSPEDFQRYIEGVIG